MQRTELRFGCRVRSFRDCNIVTKLFAQAKAACLIAKASDEDILVVKFTNDNTTPDVTILRDDVADFQTLEESIRKAGIWAADSGGKLLLEVVLVD